MTGGYKAPIQVVSLEPIKKVVTSILTNGMLRRMAGADTTLLTAKSPLIKGTLFL